MKKYNFVYYNYFNYIFARKTFMIKIRPHHLLCIHSFVGKGYNDEFIENMSSIVNAIKNSEELDLNVSISFDEICLKCPLKKNENLCESQD